MKKKLFVSLLLLMVVFVFSACNSSETEDVSPAEEETEPAVSTSMTEEEAYQSDCSFFVKSGDEFYKLYTNGYDLGIEHNMFLSNPEEEEIPTLKEGQQLVLFTLNDVMDYYTAIPVEKIGYTLPGEFLKENNDDDAALTDFRLTSYMAEAFGVEDEKTVKNLRIAMETINEEPYDSWVKNNVFNAAEYCSEPNEDYGHGCDMSDGGFYADLKQNEKVTIGYHEGSQYNEITVSANAKYYAYDGCLKDSDNEYNEEYTGIKMPASLTKASYVTLDTSDLEPGYYAIPNWNPERMMGSYDKVYLLKVE